MYACICRSITYGRHAGSLHTVPPSRSSADALRPVSGTNRADTLTDKQTDRLYTYKLLKTELAHNMITEVFDVVSYNTSSRWRQRSHEHLSTWIAIGERLSQYILYTDCRTPEWQTLFDVQSASCCHFTSYNKWPMKNWMSYIIISVVEYKSA